MRYWQNFRFRFHLDHTGNTDVFITLCMSQYQKMKTCDLGRSRDSLLLAMGISILSIDKQSDNYQNIIIRRNQLYFFKIIKSKAELSLLQETYKVCKSKNLWFLSWLEGRFAEVFQFLTITLPCLNCKIYMP